MNEKNDFLSKINKTDNMKIIFLVFCIKKTKMEGKNFQIQRIEIREVEKTNEIFLFSIFSIKITEDYINRKNKEKIKSDLVLFYFNVGF